MSDTITVPSIRAYLSGHLADVFSTMLSMEAVPRPMTEPPHFPERVTGCVGFGGESANGVVYLHLSAPFANRATAAMLGLPPEELSGEAEVNDVVGEVTNMLTGGLKSWLCDGGAPCAVSTPAIIRGASFTVEPIPDVRREWLAFDCCGEQVVVELHISLS